MQHQLPANLPATQPCSTTSLPPTLKPLVWPSYRGAGGWVLPKTVTVEQAAAAQQHVAAVAARRPSTSPEYLAGRLASFMAHFYIQVTDESLRGLKVAIASDWINCLKPFPTDVIERAFADWRDTQAVKPKPAEIRKSCIQIYGATEWEEIERTRTIAAMTPTFMPQDEVKEGPWKPPTEEQKANVAKMVEEGLRKINA